MTFPSRPKTEAFSSPGRITARLGIIARTGFQPLPDLLLFHQKDLGLSSEDLNVLLNLMAHWYEPGRHSFTNAKTIAARMDVSERSVQRSLASLKAKGFIEKASSTDEKNKTGAMAYDVTPTIEKLKVFARRWLDARTPQKVSGSLVDLL